MVPHNPSFAPHPLALLAAALAVGILVLPEYSGWGAAVCGLNYIQLALLLWRSRVGIRCRRQ